MIFKIRNSTTHVPPDFFVAVCMAVLLLGGALSLLFALGQIDDVLAGIGAALYFIGMSYVFHRFILTCAVELPDERHGDKEMIVRRVGNYYITRLPGMFNFWIIKQQIITRDDKPEYALYSHKGLQSMSLCELIRLLYEQYTTVTTPLNRLYESSKLPHLTGCDEIIGCKGTRRWRIVQKSGVDMGDREWYL